MTGGTGRRTHLAALPRALKVLWDASPAATLAVGVLSAGTGLFAVAEVHVVRRLVETAGHVVAGSAPVADALLWGAAVVALVVAAAAADAVQRLASDRHRERALLIIEEGCYRHVQSVPLERLEDAGHYDRLQRARRGMAHRFEATTNFFWWSVRDGVVLASLLIYLARVHWLLPLVLALGTTPGLLFRTRFYYLNYTLAREQVPDERRRSAINGLLLGRAAAAEIRLFALGDWLIAASQRLWARLRGERLRLGAREARALVAGDGMNAVTYLAAIVAAVLVLPPGVAAIGLYAALFVAIESFQARYAELANSVSSLYDTLRHVRDYFDFVDEPREDPEAGEHLPGPVAREIVFKDVSFTYPGADRPAVAELNLTIRPGERIALVGENGAGKTTLVKLLMGLYRPTSGRILVDGTDLCELAPADWHRRFGTVFQHYLRLQATVRENVAPGAIAGSSDDLALAAAVARSGADEVAARLPGGLETPLGRDFHEGSELSVGQWQKLAIARAYLRDGEILVLDEPASALDAKAEAEVYRHFARMAEARTVILISHRLGSCRLAGRILVLRDGRLTEQGSHEELVSSGGTYAELYRMQAAWYR